MVETSSQLQAVLLITLQNYKSTLMIHMKTRKCVRSNIGRSTSQSILPSLAEVAVVFLGIPVSSAAIEFLFSIAGNVFRPERSQLADVTFQKLMFIPCTNKYI